MIYKNWGIISEGNFRNGKVDGFGIIYHPNLITIGMFDDNIPTYDHININLKDGQITEKYKKLLPKLFGSNESE